MTSQYTLHVRVVEATNLPKMDLFGKADPYVIIQYNNDRALHRTKIIQKTYKPVWNEDFHFPVVEMSDDTIRFFIKDHDAGKSDDPISQLTIIVKTLSINSVLDKWYDCTPVKGVKKGGRLRLITHIGPTGGVPFVENDLSNVGQATKTIGNAFGAMQQVTTGITSMARQQQANAQNAANPQAAPQPQMPPNSNPQINPGYPQQPQQPAPAPQPAQPIAPIQPAYPDIDANSSPSSQPAYPPPSPAPQAPYGQVNSVPQPQYQQPPNYPPQQNYSPNYQQYPQPSYQYNTAAPPQPSYGQPSTFQLPGYNYQPGAPGGYPQQYQGGYPQQYPYPQNPMMSSNPMMGALPSRSHYNIPRQPDMRY